MDLPFTRVRPDGQLPRAQHPGDAGLDLRAAEGVTVKPGERAMVPTGVAVAIPDGHAGLVLPRSRARVQERAHVGERAGPDRPRLPG